jgi:hypothetical protein
MPSQTPRRRAIKVKNYSESSDSEEDDQQQIEPSAKRRKLDFVENEMKSFLEPMKSHIESNTTSTAPNDFYLSETNRYDQQVKKDKKGFKFVTNELISPKVLSVQWQNHLDSILARSEKSYQVNIESLSRYFLTVNGIQFENIAPPKAVYAEAARLLFDCSEKRLSSSDVATLRMEQPRLDSSRGKRQEEQQYNMKIQRVTAEWRTLLLRYYWNDKYYFSNKHVWTPDAYQFYYSLTKFFSMANMTEYAKVAIEHLYRDFVKKTQDWKVEQARASIYSKNAEDRWRAKQTLFYQMIRPIKNTNRFVENLLTLILDIFAELYLKKQQVYFAKLFGQLLDVLMYVVEQTIPEMYSRLQDKRVLERTSYRYPDMAIAALISNSEWFREEYFVSNVRIYATSKFTSDATTKKLKSDIEWYTQYYCTLEPQEFDLEDEEDLLESNNPYMIRYRLLIIFNVALLNRILNDDASSLDTDDLEQLKDAATAFADRVISEVQSEENQEAKQFVIRHAEVLKYRFQVK